jgi:uncharacterized protein (TIRG00374 family)
MARIGRLANIFFVLLGVGMLAVLVVRLDVGDVLANLRRVGWYFAASFSVYVAGLLVTTAAWQQTIDPVHSRATFRELALAFWAGHAINSVTPTGNLGEVYKGNALRARIDGVENVAALVNFNFLSTVSMQLFVALGPPLCLLMPEVPIRVTWVLFVAAGISLLPLVGLGVLLRLGSATWIVRVVSHLPFVRMRDPESLLAKARDVDRRIRTAHRERPARFLRVLLWFALARLLNALEVWVLLVPLLPDRSLVDLWLLALVTQSVSQLVYWAATFVPTAIGVVEGSSALLYGLLGIGSVVGLSMELVRRVRMILGVSVGLFIAWAWKVRAEGSHAGSTVDPSGGV